MSVGDIKEIIMNDVISGLPFPEEYNSSMFIGKVIKKCANGDNVIVLFANDYELVVPIRSLLNPRISIHKTNNTFYVNQHVQIHWIPTPSKDCTGWWSAIIVNKIGTTKCTVKYTAKFKDYPDTEVVDVSRIRLVLKRRKKKRFKTDESFT